jgi:CRP/FNR family cyclic AMP-dependent transcriptional regulator
VPRLTHSLLTLDPDLGELLDAARYERARTELMVSLVELGRAWDTARLENADPANLGLLVVRGVMARQIVNGGSVSTELLGPGDLLRPWRPQSAADVVPAEVRWTSLSPVTAAVLDRRLAAQLSGYPEINAVLIDRVSERAHRLAVTLAISQLTGVDRRLDALLWHLAGRFGRVVPGGVLLPLSLSHRLLGEIVGARRPTVSTALSALMRAGRLQRRPDGAWLLLDPPADQRPAAALASAV